ncbi:MAG: PatB family C-S lyase [Campylobacterota bacterium]|nr:PatB family C-S lyase [Campylobacterota bacterium]
MYEEIMSQVHDRSLGNSEKYQLRQQLFKTEDVLPMWVADMDIVTPPFIAKAVSERVQNPIYGYEMMPESAYEAQIAWMQRRHSLHVKREWMFYSPSVVASINLSIQAFTEPGDKIIVQTPVYFPFMSSITNNERCIIRNPLKEDERGDYTFDLEDLKSKIDKDTKLLLLCSPHNPVGRVWKKEELLALGEICLENDIKVFADEIHSDLVFDGYKHTPFSSLSDEIRDITITAIGPGKTFNLAGLAISTLVIADKIMHNDFEKVYKAVHFAEGTVFGHVAFESAYKQGDIWIDELMQYLSYNIQLLEDMLKKHPNTLTCKHPQGTYLLWIDCRALGLSDKALRELFIKKGKLGLSPGTSFGKEGSGFMRMNIAVPLETMQEALKRLHQILELL